MNRARGMIHIITVMRSLVIIQTFFSVEYFNSKKEGNVKLEPKDRHCAC